VQPITNPTHLANVWLKAFGPQWSIRVVLGWIHSAIGACR
jgi:hypothetical protein